ncbi:thioredoxin TrxC [Nitratireductor mangrovi]|uniref:Thioredoxin TrxC n=1 Tax=Nitratireductor mangrovi TaxID=2599600 RepID=A0A5B8L0E0_9HYPH|nr:thioredoxin TrxC [Nitratireductor mangrovi]QDZ01351.1 thioredoxin TrxC [Nitratireductor mangrovi]
MVEKLVVCGSCGGINRLPEARPATGAKCGKCASKLFRGHPDDISGDNLGRQIDRGTLPVLVDVWAPWCGPCRTMAPAFEAAAAVLEPEVRLVKLNSDRHQATSAELGIRGIPTMILFAGGREIARVSGAMTTGEITNWVRERLPAVAS